MDLIKRLAENNYNLFNVNEKKQPIDKNGKALIDWNDISTEELKKNHNYNSELWGMRMGLQGNDQRILSLDFDCCGKENKEKTQRVGCEYTKNKLEEYKSKTDNENGMYTSSTEGNINVLIDYTDTPDIVKMVEQIGSNKFAFEGFEILLGGNQVIPPSSTICKISKKKGKARSFLTDEPFYELTEESPVYNFVKDLFIKRLDASKPKIPRMKRENAIEEGDKGDDKYTKLLFDVIGNDVDDDGCKIITRDQWFQICGILKYNGYDKDIWLRYSGLMSNTNTASIIWDGIKNTTPMSIYGLQVIAKAVNNEKYKEWLDDSGEKMYLKPFTTGLVADYFSKLYGDKFVCSYDEMYSYNGVVWVKSDKRDSELANFIDTVFYKELDEYITRKLWYYSNLETVTKMEEAKNKSTIDMIKGWISKCNKLRNNSQRKSLIDDIYIKLTNNDIKFDNDPYLFAFNNCVYDLRKGEFVKSRADMYITKTSGYDYVKSDNDKLEKLKHLIGTIFPDKEVRDDYLTILATGLSGIQMENFIVATGQGGNGKSLLHSLLMKTLGSYGYVLPSSVLLKEIKDGANPAIANLDNVRFALVSEPDSNQKINTSVLKELTGNKTLNVRNLYSTKCKTNLCLTLVMECNRLPLLDEVNEAIVRRLRVSLFESTFYLEDERYQDEVKAGKKNVYMGSSLYKTVDWMEDYKCVLFDLLLEWFSIFRMNNYTLKQMPARCKKETAEYMAVSDDLFGWVSEQYTQDDDAEPIKFKDLYEHFKLGEIYQNSSRDQKRKYSMKWFYDELDKNIFLRKYIKRRKEYYKSKRLDSDCLVGWNKERKVIEENICLGDGGPPM